MSLTFDEIAKHTEEKLDIFANYANTFCKIVHSFPNRIFIDAFAGSGTHVLKDTKEEVDGTSVNIFSRCNFTQYHFIDIDKEKLGHLKSRIENIKEDASVCTRYYNEDSNSVICNNLVPEIQKMNQSSYVGLGILDPYGTNLKFDTIRKLSNLHMDLIIHVSVQGFLRYLAPKNTNKQTNESKNKAIDFFGASDCLEKIYSKEANTLFDGVIPKREENSNAYKSMIEYYIQNLREIALFKHAYYRLFTNSKNSPQYYLVFTSHHNKGGKIGKFFAERYTLNDQDKNRVDSDNMESGDGLF